MACIARPDAEVQRPVDRTGASGRSDRSVRSARPLPSEGVTASLALGAINRSGLRPCLVLSTSRDLVSMLVSAWEPSITYILDSDHSIV